MPYLTVNYDEMGQFAFWREVHYNIEHRLNMVLLREGDNSLRRLANSVRRYAASRGEVVLVKQREEAVLVTFL